MSEKKLTHLNADGQSHMVDVSGRDVTVRTAQASGHVKISSEVIVMLRDNTVPKGDVLATARIAGIMGAKRTPELIPLCHPIAAFTDVSTIRFVHHLYYQRVQMK